jgi:hypothetical protein
MTSFLERVIGAAKFDVRIYEEVEADTSAIGQAMAVVVLSSLAAGTSLSGRLHPVGMLTGTVAALAGWAIWAGLTYFIGTRILPSPQTRADWGELLRVTGFAASPGILRFLGFLPMVGPVINVATGLWMLATFVVAVRQALDYTSTLRAVGVCLIGWVVASFLLVMAGRLLPSV